TRLLEADAREAGVDPSADPLQRPRPVAPPGTVRTDTPADRETDFGRLDRHSSAIRAEGDPRRSRRAVPDYAATAAGADQPELARAQWSGARVTASSSASDSRQPGVVQPAYSVAAAVDDDPDTNWRPVAPGRRSGSGSR